MKYLVEALETYEKGNIADSELSRVPKTGEQWEVNEQRLEVLLGKNTHNAVFVKLVEKEENSEEVSEEVVQAVANAIVQEATEQDKKVEDVINEIVEESEEVSEEKKSKKAKKVE